MNVVNIHPIGFEERPHGHHPCLFRALKPYLEARGHALLPPDRIAEADIANFDSGVWTLEGGPGGYAPYDWKVLNYVISNKTPVAYNDNFDHWGTPTYDCTWPGKNDWHDMQTHQEQDYARFAYLASRDCRILYFMRKMQAEGQTYPDWVYPLEYPLFDDFPLVSKEELFARPNDVCFLANDSIQRQTAHAGFSADPRLKYDGAMMPVRIDHWAWVGRHRNAKLFVECDASMGSERPQRLMTEAAMLRVRSDHRLPFPRQDMVHQVLVGDVMGKIEPEDIDKILSVVNDADLLYSIYVNGAEHMRKYYSIEARCNYVIDLMEEFLRCA